MMHQLPSRAMNILLQKMYFQEGDGYQRATVVHSKNNVDEELILLHNCNPILNNRVYEAVLPGGERL